MIKYIIIILFVILALIISEVYAIRTLMSVGLVLGITLIGYCIGRDFNKRG